MKERRHTNKHGMQGTKSGSRMRRLKRLAKAMHVPFGKQSAKRGEKHGT